VHQVLKRTLAIVHPRPGNPPGTLPRHWFDELPLVSADPDLTRKVFLNLGLNAIKAMPEGGEMGVATGVRRYRTRRSMVDRKATQAPAVGPPRIMAAPMNGRCSV